MNKQLFTGPHPFEVYWPEGKGPFPLLCITPLLGRLLILEDMFLEKYFARFFAKKGFAAAVIHRPIFGFDPAQGLEQIQIYLEESLKRNRQVLDALLKDPRVDGQRVGSFGMSFGSIINSLWGAEDDRFRAHAFALAGGNLPGIFVTSRDPLMRSYYRAALKRSGLAPEKLSGELEKIFKWDPLSQCASIPPEKVLLCLALFDRVVAYRFGEKLRKVLKEPETILLPLGHYTSILAAPLLKWKVLSFFKRKLL